MTSPTEHWQISSSAAERLRRSRTLSRICRRYAAASVVPLMGQPSGEQLYRRP